ncbi:MAG: restriction endonuclease subunit S, partial [Bifidobacterium sp.]|nr:restriction endonuclease subunit S [Bifidobacterium sp.]
MAEIRRGASPRPIHNKKWFSDNGEYGWLKIADATEQNGEIHSVSLHLSKLGEAHTVLLHDPHLIMSIAASVGKPLINYCPVGIHDGFIVFLDLQINQSFLFTWLLHFQAQWQKYGQPGSQVNLNADLVAEQTIPHPNSDEQNKISEFFKTLDDLIAACERKTELLKKRKSYYLQQIFSQRLRFKGFTQSWQERKLG